MRATGHLSLSAAIIAAAGFALAVSPSAAAPATCHAASGPQTTPLVELFTSEGCDSCPPADRWLSAQFPPPPRSAPARAGTLALAFHVDYWDRLGWRDRFASAQFTQRQYDEMEANGAAFVYTPQVLVQGHAVADWKSGKAAEAIAAAGRRTPRAAVMLDIAPGTGGPKVAATASVADPTLRKRAVMWLAFVDSGHVTDVAAGENRGARLRHDNVVRSLHGPYSVDANGAAVATVALASPASPGTSPTVVAFVQDTRNGDVLQALAAPDCRDP
jgi:hypothetical protein